MAEAINPVGRLHLEGDYRTFCDTIDKVAIRGIITGTITGICLSNYLEGIHPAS